LDVAVQGQAPNLSGTVTVRSLAGVRIPRLKVEPIWAPGLGPVEPRSWWVRDLQPGESRRLSFSAQVTPRFVRERFRGRSVEERQLAFRARVWQSGDWPRAAHAFSYWKAEPAGEGPAAMAPATDTLATMEP
jgi:hypothetical protein